MTAEVETPWFPGREDLPWTWTLVNPHGDRHLTFNGGEGRFYRLWQRRPPTPMRADEAMMLRPSDVNLIIREAMMWVSQHPDEPQTNVLTDEVSAGAKALVVHFAKMAGAY